MSTVAISPEQQRVLELIERRLDQLETAAGATVTSILAAAHRLPAADRLAVHRRLMTIGHPPIEWASALHD